MFNARRGRGWGMLEGMIEEDVIPKLELETVPEGGAEVTFRFDDPGWLKVEILDAEGNGRLLSHDPGKDEATLSVDSFFVRYVEAAGGGRLVPHVVTNPAPAAGGKLRISRVTPLEQPLALPANAPLPARALEHALDRLTMALQDREAENGALFRNVLSFPPTEPDGFRTQLPEAEERSGRLLGFDGQTGEMKLVTVEDMTLERAAAQFGYLQGKVETLRQDTESYFEQAYKAAAQDYYYRHVANDGMKFGVIGNLTQLTDSENAPGERSLTIQPGATTLAHRAKGNLSIAIGYDTHAEAEHAVSIGSYAKTSGQGAVGLGHHAAADGMHAVAVGNGASTRQHSSVAVGALAAAPTPQDVPMRTGAVAVGNMAEAAGAMGTALGYRAKAAGERSLAVGCEAKAPGARQISFGYQAGSGTHPAVEALSLGAYSQARAEKSCALGIRCEADGAGGTAVGVQTWAHGARSTAVGWQNRVEAPDGCAFGYGNLVKAAAQRSTAIGHGVVMEVPDCVDIRAAEGGVEAERARILLSGRTGAAQISYRVADAPPTTVNTAWGNEAAPGTGEFHVPPRMLSFRVNAAKTLLYIDVSVVVGGTPQIRTAEIDID